MSIDVSQFRHDVRQSLCRIYTKYKVPEPQQCAQHTEHGVYKAYPIHDTHISFEFACQTEYYHVCAHIIANVDPTQYIRNSTLIRRIATGKINPADLGTMTPRQLYPEHWNQSVARLALEKSHRRMSSR